MNESGYIKLFRSLKDQPWYHDSQAVHLFVHCLLEATHQGREYIVKGKPVTLKPGQFITGRNRLSAQTGINESKIQRLLKMFENCKQIEQQMNSANRCISILNWQKFQNSEQQMNSERTANEQQVNSSRTQNKNVKNDKKVKNEKNHSAGEEKNSFEKLANQVGHITAKMLIEGQAGEMLNTEKKTALLKWLSYRYQKGSQLTTTHELLETIRIFQDNSASDLEAAMKKSFTGGWKIIKIEKNAKSGNSDNYTGHLVSQSTLESALRMVTDSGE